MSTTQKRILYVDDDEDDRVIMAASVERVNPNVEVVLAENGLEALEWLKSAQESESRLTSLIVLDQNMPFHDGRETFQRQREDTGLQKITVIVFSSSENPGDKAQFTALGIEFLTKPSSIANMSEIVNHMISLCC
jgi:CheY-like chemotaxis protein